jgi:hypothetical protein
MSVDSNRPVLNEEAPALRRPRPGCGQKAVTNLTALGRRHPGSVPLRHPEAGGVGRASGRFTAADRT